MATTAQCRNRRLAYVAVLEKRGYFSEEAMRFRAPLLYATYVGRYVAQEAAAPEGEEGSEALLSAELLRRADDAHADERLARDLRRLDAEEVDSSSEEDEHRAGADEEVAPHDSLVAELRDLMVARFLGGMEATGIDYGAIDADASLDDAWQKTIEQDAEDAYFADD